MGKNIKKKQNFSKSLISVGTEDKLEIANKFMKENKIENIPDEN